MSSSANLITGMPLAKLAGYMSWANRGNGALLLLTGVLGVFGALSHAAADTFSSLLLSIYVGGFGALLLMYELSAGAELRRDYGFMYTYLGRAAFLLLCGNLAWTCDPLGMVAAISTNANAVLSAYVMWAHPSFVGGVASATAIGGFDGEQGTELIYNGGAHAGIGRSSSAGVAADGGFDPASAAARERAESISQEAYL
jgi:hypothetical protein